MIEENKPIGSGIEDPHTLFEMHEKIEHKEYVLPAIQRKFVWEEKDITRLFDSLMLGYPIGSFLISPSNANTCLTLKYYACLKQRNYDEAFDNNMELDPVSYPDSFLLLDGQQRLTSIHIGLTGCIIRRGQTDERKLYYNYKKTPDLNKDKFHNKSYEFEFLKSKDKKVKEWFLVNDILKYKDNLKDLLAQYAKNQIEEENLTRLHYVVFENKNLHVYKMSNDSSVYDILSVFDRLNSSGTKLSNPNLIFSVLVSKWNNARQEIDSLLNTINKKGFQFTEEYVIKFALVAIGLPSTLKLKDFSVNNDVNTISENWEVIKCSIIETITLLSEKYYMNQDHIISENAIIPINYLLYLRLKEKKKNSNKDITEYKYTNLISYDKKDDSKLELFELRKLLVLLQTQKLFSSRSNVVVDDLCKFILKHETNAKKGNKEITIDIFKTWKSGDKSISLNDEYIDSLFLTNKGRKAFLILSLLYPEQSLKSSDSHQDHLHAASKFKGRNWTKNFSKPSSDDIKFYKEEYNLLANLHLLDMTKNIKKGNEALNQWFKDKPARIEEVACLPYKGDDEVKKGDYTKYTLDNFKNFINDRKQIMKQEFKKLFGL